jgi:hypothetical protein
MEDRASIAFFVFLMFHMYDQKSKGGRKNVDEQRNEQPDQDEPVRGGRLL